MKQLLELPLNLAIVSPAHTPNWDLVSDVVNSCSRIYRSSKQCRSRYENVLIPREEGKVSAHPCSPPPLAPTGLQRPAPRSLARWVACAVPGAHPRLRLHGRRRCGPRSHTWKVLCAVRKLGPPSSLFLSFPEKVSGELESLSLAPLALPQESVGVFPAVSLPCSHRACWLPRWQDRLWTPVPPTVHGTCRTHSSQVLGIFPEKPAVAAA